MLLTVDVGNTNTVLGLFDGDRLVRSWRTKTDAHDTADELALTLRGLIDDIEVTGISACSTVPAVLRELRGMLARYWDHVPTVVIGPGIRTGVPLLVDNPREVGSDRVVNSLAAFHLYGGPAIVVDFGTCTSFDVVSAKGEFLGGPLAPGLVVSHDAVVASAAQLREVELTAPRNTIGKNTTEALQAGVLYGFAGLVDGLVRRVAKEMRIEVTDASVIATGGLASLVIDSCETVGEHEPDLTLIGLRLAYEKNL